MSRAPALAGNRQRILSTHTMFPAIGAGNSHTGQNTGRPEVSFIAAHQRPDAPHILWERLDTAGKLAIGIDPSDADTVDCSGSPTSCWLWRRWNNRSRA